MTDIDLVRTLIPDTDMVFGDASNEYLFADQQITNFLTVGKGNVLRAAAYANYAIATSEVLISKKIRTQDLQTDGAVIAAQLIAKGKELMAQAAKEDALAAIDTSWRIINFGDGWGSSRPELTEYPFDSEGNLIDTSLGYGRGGYGE